MPPPIWKKPIEDCRRQFLVPVGERDHVLDAGAHGVDVLRRRRQMQWPAYMLPSVESSQPGTNIGRFFSAAAIIQESFGSIW